MADLVRVYLNIPAEWRDAIPEGMKFSEFARDALRREFKRLKIQVLDLPEIKAGRPWPATDSDDKDK